MSQVPVQCPDTVSLQYPNSTVRRHSRLDLEPWSFRGNTHTDPLHSFGPTTTLQSFQ